MPTSYTPGRLSGSGVFPQARRGPSKRLPDTGAPVRDQEQLDAAARWMATRDQPRGKDARVVDDEEVAASKFANYVGERPVRNGAARSFERVIEVQQGFAKEAYETFVAEATKLNEMYAAAAKEAYKPYEATFAAFGVKAPK